jgi:uncharacterized membrane protein HdeD (DUF308 family)
MSTRPESGSARSAPASKKFRWRVFAIGMVAIALGYVLLALNSITVAPILLVLGYCVLVPLAFL